MTDVELFQKLEEISSQLGVEVRRELGDYSGGLCRVGEFWMFIINPNLPVSRQVEILRSGLSRLDLSGLFLLPAIREYLNTSGQ